MLTSLVSRLSSLGSLQLLVEQREYAPGGIGVLLGAVLVVDLDLAAAGRVLDLDAVLLLLGLAAAAPREHPGEKAFLGVGGRGVELGIDVTHEVEALGAVAVLDGEADPVERQPDA